MNDLVAILFVAVVVEGIIEYLGKPIPKGYKCYAAALLGIVVCLLFRVNMLGWMGQEAFPHAGEILTGITVGRGSNYINNRLGKVKK
ncbi:MAG: hypothetical protein HC893_00030 [Chloroflexaceae bacterium]|nr:hypothetical protein [Chloroflexaceae bacterium]